MRHTNLLLAVTFVSVSCGGVGGTSDGGTGDAAPFDGGARDSAVRDSMVADTSRPDSGPFDDSGPSGDGGSVDGGPVDGGPVDGGAACAPGRLRSGDYFVSPSGDNGNTGTAEAPFRTVQRAADMVNPGDTVVVADGVYTAAGGAAFVVNVHRGGSEAGGWVTFRSENPWAATIDASGAEHRGFNISTGTSYVRIEGFEIRDAPKEAIKLHGMSAHVEIVSNNIHGARGAAAISIHGTGDARSSDVLIDGNFIHHNGDSVFRTPGERGYDPDNQNKDHGVYLSPLNAIIRNNVFTHQEHGWSIQLSEGASGISIYNNVFAYPNPNRDGHIMLWQRLTDIAIYNNVFFEPRGAPLNFLSSTLLRVDVRNNLTTAARMTDGDEPPGEVMLDGNILGTDPLFEVVAPELPLDFRPTASSPLVDMGTTLAAVPWDYLATCRPQGDASDIGPFEVIR